jgi:hypothetical protein
MSIALRRLLTPSRSPSSCEDGTIGFYPPEGVWIPISEELARFIRRERPFAHLIHEDFTWKVYAGHHPGLIGRARDLLPELFE